MDAVNQQIEEGARVRFVTGPLGALSGALGEQGDTRFVGAVHKGSEGTYRRPRKMPSRVAWHDIEVEIDGAVCTVPAHASQFTMIA